MPAEDRSEVGRWSGIDTKEMNFLLPSDRIAGNFTKRIRALPDTYAEDSRITRVTNIMTTLITKA